MPKALDQSQIASLLKKDDEKQQEIMDKDRIAMMEKMGIIVRTSPVALRPWRYERA
jgi:hypothetical protein